MENQNQSNDIELKKSFYFLLIAGMYLAIAIIIVVIAAISDSYGLDMLSWKWYYWVLLSAIILFILGLTFVLGKNMLLSLAYWLSNRTKEIKNKAKSLDELKTESSEWIDRLEKIVKHYEIQVD